MPNQLVSSAAIAIVCLALPAGVALAQQRAHPYYGSSSPAYGYSYRAPQPAAATLVGTYKSDAFYPSPLTLTITGIDRYGNLSGWIAGMRSEFTVGVGDRWENWHRVFGQDGTRAYYRDGRITITFPNGATYALEVRGTELAGQFTATDENRRISFLKSYPVAAR